MSETKSVEVRLFEAAMHDIRNQMLECALLEDLPAIADASVTDDIGWIVGLLPDAPKDDGVRYCSYFFAGYSPEAEQALKTVLAELPADSRSDYIAPQERIRQSGTMTIAVVMRTVHEGKHVWLLYHHPLIGIETAGGYVLCSVESERQKRLSFS